MGTGNPKILSEWPHNAEDMKSSTVSAANDSKHTVLRMRRGEKKEIISVTAR